MAIGPCPECGHKVSTRAASCPSCGYPIAASAPVTVNTKSAVVTERTGKPLKKKLLIYNTIIFFGLVALIGGCTSIGATDDPGPASVWSMFLGGLAVFIGLIGNLGTHILMWWRHG